MVETVTLSQAKTLISSLADEQSLLLLSPPGLGKSDIIAQAASEADLPLRSLLGTQIAPEDVSGIPRIVGERSVFCPPRVLLPEDSEPFCLFLDELPAASPDIQKAFYSLLLERRVGETQLPPKTWVVAAGNRSEDRALVRGMSSALVNRVCVLNVRLDHKEWIVWAREHQVHPSIIAFLLFLPDALMREVPQSPVPFSTPRSWTLLSDALKRMESRGSLDYSVRRALAFGRVSAQEAAIYCAMQETGLDELRPVEYYFYHPDQFPKNETQRWFYLSQIRHRVEKGTFFEIAPESLNAFLMSLPEEHRFCLFVDLVPQWGALGAKEAMLDSLLTVTGIQ